MEGLCRQGLLVVVSVLIVACDKISENSPCRDYPSDNCYFSGAEVDENGVTLRSFEFVNRNPAGLDGQYFTEDDILSRWMETREESSSVGKKFLDITYDAPGPDGSWFSADDMVGTYVARTELTDAEWVSISYVATGADGEWFTSDDVSEAEYSVSFFQLQSENSPGVFRLDVFAVGDDGVALTADDEVVYYSEFTSLAAESSGHFLIAPGPDGQAHTADDLLQRMVYTPSQYVVRLAGEDGVFDTQDDVIVHQSDSLSTVEDDGREVTTRIETHRAYDFNEQDQSFTFGDVRQFASKTTVDPQGDLLRVHYSGLGTDGTWFTADDVIDFYEREYKIISADGRAIDWNVVYPQAGEDGVWFSDDDQPAVYTQLISTTLPQGVEMSVSRSGIGAGDDGIWFTPDDKAKSQHITLTKKP